MIDAKPSRRVDHVPVLLAQVLSALKPRDNATYIDATFGAGGYARAILAHADCRLYGIDRDPEAVEIGRRLTADMPEHMVMIEGRFGDIEALLAAHGVAGVDGGIVLDLGVSSMQLDQPNRGFSFRADGPLDMRMGADGATAGDVVNQTDEKSLARLIAQYGEERRARRVARAIAAARSETPITRTGQLAELVRRVVPPSADGIDPATRTFQALRIYVNDELGQLERALRAAERLLVAGGRLVVVSFHSLEDRLVKRFLRRRAGAAARPSRHQPMDVETDRAPSFELINRRPIGPDKDEIEANPRARSARLRAAIRTGHAAWPAEAAA